VLSSGENVYEALGEGFTLLSLDAEESDVALCEADAEKAGIPLTIVRDSFADDRMEFEARLVLVRPDQFVVWAADSAPPDMTALLAKVTGSSS
jgi:hypothetical protein